jgi:hypothetical protein
MKYLMLTAAVLMTGCTNIDAVTSDAQMAVAMAAEAKEMALVAKASADEAKASAAQANSTANDAVEAVSRMAEKCCRK